MESWIAKTGKLPGEKEFSEARKDEIVDLRNVHVLHLHAAASVDERLQETNSLGIGLDGCDSSLAEKRIDVNPDCEIGVVFFVAFRVLPQVH